jgi:seryl-tRNA synthetase
MDSALSAQLAFRDELLAAGLLLDTGVPGVYGRSAVFESVIERFDRFVTRAGAEDAPTRLRFPPVLSRKHFETSGYMGNMPQLAGTIHSFEGAQPDHAALLKTLQQGEDWSGHQRMTELVLTPAGCYPVYPTLKGKLSREGRLIDVFSYCFRHEPSPDPARMQLFRMREYVRIGLPEDVRRWRAGWLDRGAAMMHVLGLEAHVALANDPFFGRTGKLLAASQREQELKYELVVPITSTDTPTALLSFNYHQDLFGGLYGIEIEGEPAHTGCVGFGMERVVLALLKTHGLDPDSWPRQIREALGP